MKIKKLQVLKRGVMIKCNINATIGIARRETTDFSFDLISLSSIKYTTLPISEYEAKS